MDIKLLTFSNTPNYGALLQTYALCEVLKSLGGNVELLKVNLNESSFLNFLRRHLYDRFMIEFQKMYLPPFCEIENVDINSIYIVGSDQVWNPCFINSHKYLFFFDFLHDNIKRISYAASFGESKLNLSHDDKNQMGLLLKKFSALSVRESFAVDICEQEFNLEPEFVLDPTLLLSNYSKICVPLSESNNLVSFKFVQSSQYYKLLGFLTNELNLDICRLDDRYVKWRGKEYFSKHLSVATWIRCIAESKMVITDSFHALSFALIYKKPFLVLPSVVSRMGRVVSLLRLLGLENRYYNSIDEVYDRLDWMEPINYEKVDCILRSERVKSFNYLKQSLDL